MKRAASKVEFGFFGVMDGAPDDQIQICRGPDFWHALGIVLAPNRDHLHAFCQRLRTRLPGGLHKWNGGVTSREAKRYWQTTFAREFLAGLRADPQITCCIYGAQAATITNFFPDFFDQVVIPYAFRLTDERLRHRVIWRLDAIKTNGITPVGTLRMDWKIAAVIVWMAAALKNLYRHARHHPEGPPRWILHADRLPGSDKCSGLPALVALLASWARIPITVQAAVNDRGNPDADDELLADCIATWGREAFANPTSELAQQLLQAAESPDLTQRLFIDRMHRDDNGNGGGLWPPPHP